VKKTKYALMYARDLSIPPSAGNSELVEFTSLFGLLRFIIKTPAVRAAIKADRYHWIRIVPTRSEAP
jgi:hypothetical protein